MPSRAVQEGESSGEVWEAALSCLLHMCCRDGVVTQRDVRGLPPATARALLLCCRAHGWCDCLPWTERSAAGTERSATLD